MMLQGQPSLYSTIFKEGSKEAIRVMFYPSLIREKGFVNFTELTFSDIKNKLLPTILRNFKVPIVTASDLLSHDAYIDLLKEYETTVVMYVGENENEGSVSINRRLKAISKLEFNGISVLKFNNKVEFNELLENNFQTTETLPQNVVKGNFPLLDKGV